MLAAYALAFVILILVAYMLLHRPHPRGEYSLGRGIFVSDSNTALLNPNNLVYKQLSSIFTRPDEINPVYVCRSVNGDVSGVLPSGAMASLQVGDGIPRGVKPYKVHVVDLLPPGSPGPQCTGALRIFVFRGMLYAFPSGILSHTLTPTFRLPDGALVELVFTDSLEFGGILEVPDETLVKGFIWDVRLG